MIELEKTIINTKVKTKISLDSLDNKLDMQNDKYKKLNKII